MQNKSNPNVDQLNDNKFEFEYSDISKIVWTFVKQHFRDVQYTDNAYRNTVDIPVCDNDAVARIFRNR